MVEALKKEVASLKKQQQQQQQQQDTPEVLALSKK